MSLIYVYKSSFMTQNSSLMFFTEDIRPTKLIEDINKLYNFTCNSNLMSYSLYKLDYAINDDNNKINLLHFIIDQINNNDNKFNYNDIKEINNHELYMFNININKLKLIVQNFIHTSEQSSSNWINCSNNHNVQTIKTTRKRNTKRKNVEEKPEEKIEEKPEEKQKKKQKFNLKSNLFKSNLNNNLSESIHLNELMNYEPDKIENSEKSKKSNNSKKQTKKQNTETTKSKKNSKQNKVENKEIVSFEDFEDSEQNDEIEINEDEEF